MTKKLSVLSVIVAVSFLSLVEEVAAITSKEFAVIINLAGRQRMLTQKMSKEMLLVANGVDADKNRGELKKTAALFDKTLKGLINGSAEQELPPTKDKTTLRVISKVEGLWAEFKSVVDSVAGGGSADVAKIADSNLPLLKNMNTVVGLYEKQAKKATGKTSGAVINLSGKQRMLTQKMSKEMLLMALKHKTNENRAELKRTASLFDRTLRGLKNGDTDLGLPATTDGAIVAQLDKIDGLWKGFKALTDKVVASGSTSKDDLKKMAELNIPLLKEMNKAVKMYEVAGK